MEKTTSLNTPMNKYVLIMQYVPRQSVEATRVHNWRWWPTLGIRESLLDTFQLRFEGWEGVN